MELPPQAYRTATWREGTNTELSSRFAVMRVRPAHRDYLGTEMRPEEWLLIEWPEGEAEPTKYFLSTAPTEATLEQLVFITKMRWRIERDYRELKQELGLSHYEGRGWQGFHHHATLCIAAYGFLVAQRLSHGGPKKTVLDQKRLPYPQTTSLAAAGRAQRHVPDSIPTRRFLIAQAIARRFQRCPCCGGGRYAS